MTQTPHAGSALGAAGFVFLAACLVFLSINESSGVRWVYLLGAACALVTATIVFRSRRT